MVQDSEDAKLLQGLLSGDKATIEKIYQSYFKGISSYVGQNNGTEEDARDIFQEGMMVFFQLARKDDFILTSSFYTLLYAICKRLWLKKIKKSQKEMVTFYDTDEYISIQPFGDHIEEEERYNLYRKYFNQLPNSCKRLLQLFFQKVSMEQISGIMGFSSVAYAKKRKYQCKEKLIEQIQQDDLYQELL
ncbi:MAG TPA: sigma-70 family RNA polymerase sigma factor [Saprospiraceae bacterium]|nr:sigma-70 family RNA polymerase sigma factor [Saprospiraceae bacterium]HMQ82481.1 sigma-70 family RNA polymerase sigma factor [Saprospiraceae bacterium]